MSCATSRANKYELLRPRYWGLALQVGVALVDAHRRIFTLSLPRTFIHLYVHWGYHHQFRTLISLLDLLLMLRRAEGLIPATVLPVARDYNCSRVLALSMAAIQSITDSDMGPWIDRHILSTVQEQGLLQKVEGYYHHGGKWRGRRLKALCLDSAQSRRRVLRSFLAAKVSPLLRVRGE